MKYSCNYITHHHQQQQDRMTALRNKLWPPHAHSPDVATVARRMRIDVHDNEDDNEVDNDNA